MTTPRFELTSQRQKVSRLPTEPPRRYKKETAMCHTQKKRHFLRIKKETNQKRTHSLVSLLCVAVGAHSCMYGHTYNKSMNQPGKVPVLLAVS